MNKKHWLVGCVAILLALLVGALPWQSAQAASTLQFSGYTWEVRSGFGGPGPNNWDANNVWVDSEGMLHLKISYRNGAWYGAELSMNQRLGYGTYRFQLIGAVDKLDPNIVFGLFNYPTPDVGGDATNEIDIEFARWGNAAWPNGNYTVWPAHAGVSPSSHSFEFGLNGTYTTHSFTWRPGAVDYLSQHGHRTDNQSAFHQWTTPASYAGEVATQPMPLHINLWLFQGQAPQNGQEVELIVKSFTYTPLGSQPTATPVTPPTATPRPTTQPTATPRPTATPQPTATGCSAPAWSRTTIYYNGNVVSHNGRQWRAKWWTLGEEPGTTGQWGVWLDLGACR